MTEAAKQIRREYAKKQRDNATPEARAAKNAYMREWRKNNKDKIKASNERYWEKKAMQAAQLDVK